MQYIDDMAALGEAIGDLVPAPDDKRLKARLEKWTKYERTISPTYGEPLWAVNVGDDMSLVAVTNPATRGVALILRQFSHEEPVLDRETGEQVVNDDGSGRVRFRYEVLGLRPCADAETAEDLLQQVRRQVELAEARTVDGFGEPGGDEEEPEIGF